METTQIKPEDDELLIAEIIEAEKPKHQRYHYHIGKLIKFLNYNSKNRAEPKLAELKAIMHNLWQNSASHWPEDNKMLIWACHFTISKMLVKERRKNKQLPHGMTEGIQLLTLKDINEYYAFAGVVLMAINETDVATIMCCTKAKLSRMLEQQIPTYYRNHLFRQKDFNA
ncbi:hypothetical protein [Pedobacter nyackensis]|uniref:hypothetical protein n=1 Tax=Pedobacter nyackensis TaxID=475255 RepID=UPI00292F06FC|nr:hypothetical protein [Pedobacter nyackensis]